MLYYDRIDVSEGIDANKTNKSKKCDVLNISIFKIKGLGFSHMYTTYTMIC